MKNINGIRRWQTGSDTTKEYRHRIIYAIDRSSGELNVYKDNITDYPSNETGNLSILNDEGLNTGHFDLGFDETIIGRKENLKGQIINSARDSALLDRFIIIVPYAPHVVAGKVVNMKFYMRDLQTGNYIISPVFSGNYLVENSEHVFNGEKLKPFSKFIIARKHIKNIPGNYDLQKKLMKAG
jgi:hypothetical protein